MNKRLKVVLSNDTEFQFVSCHLEKSEHFFHFPTKKRKMKFWLDHGFPHLQKTPGYWISAIIFTSKNYLLIWTI